MAVTNPSPTTIAAPVLRDLPVASIRPGDNDRKVFRNIESLAADMNANGLLNPISVRELAPGSYEILAGERRWRAAAGAGWVTIPAIVRDADDEAASRAMLSENLQRDHRDPIAEANAYRTRLDRFPTLDEHDLAELDAADAMLPRLRVVERGGLETMVPWE
jgi:ParB family transcriptional regulator, chromosome partitioning protein